MVALHQNARQASDASPGSSPYVGRLRPSHGRLYVVRWLRTDGQEARQRFFRRRPDALRYASVLEGFGKTVAIYSSDITSWTEVAS